jgi:hypothetical protein
LTPLYDDTKDSGLKIVSRSGIAVIGKRPLCRGNADPEALHITKNPHGFGD